MKNHQVAIRVFLRHVVQILSADLLAIRRHALACLTTLDEPQIVVQSALSVLNVRQAKHVLMRNVVIHALVLAVCIPRALFSITILSANVYLVIPVIRFLVVQK